MEKTTLSNTQKVAITALMREHGISAKALQYALDLYNLYGGIPELKNGEKLELELRYMDNSLSPTFLEGEKITGVHTLGVDVSLRDAPVPLPYDAAVKFCQQAGCALMSEAEARLIFSEKKKINQVLESICGEPLKDYFYWVEGRCSKPYLVKAINLETGLIKEFRKTESFRVRPVK